jgi:hypothetical protein
MKCGRMEMLTTLGQMIAKKVLDAFNEDPAVRGDARLHYAPRRMGSVAEGRDARECTRPRRSQNIADTRIAPSQAQLPFSDFRTSSSAENPCGRGQTEQKLSLKGIRRFTRVFDACCGKSRASRRENVADVAACFCHVCDPLTASQGNSKHVQIFQRAAGIENDDGIGGLDPTILD